MPNIGLGMLGTMPAATASAIAASVLWHAALAAIVFKLGQTGYRTYKKRYYNKREEHMTRYILVTYLRNACKHIVKLHHTNSNFKEEVLAELRRGKDDVTPQTVYSLLANQSDSFISPSNKTMFSHADAKELLGSSAELTVSEYVAQHFGRTLEFYEKYLEKTTTSLEKLLRKTKSNLSSDKKDLHHSWIFMQQRIVESLFDVIFGAMSAKLGSSQLVHEHSIKAYVHHLIQNEDTYKTTGDVDVEANLLDMSSLTTVKQYALTGFDDLMNCFVPKIHRSNMRKQFKTIFTDRTTNAFEKPGRIVESVFSQFHGKTAISLYADIIRGLVRMQWVYLQHKVAGRRRPMGHPLPKRALA